MLIHTGMSKFLLRRNNNIIFKTYLPPWRSFSQELQDIQTTYVVHRRGDPGHGSREYMLCPPDKTIEEAKAEKLIVAAILAHRNIVFGARSFRDDFTLDQICHPLVDKAVKDASINGEQPQAIASLSGLSDWVKSCLDGDMQSDELNKLKEQDPVGFEAVKSIATGIPRKGHSVVGVGTYRDGEAGWKAIAKEFVEQQLSEESNLYQNRGAQLVKIEHLADRNPEYLQTAGGAMARFFFV